MYDVIVVGARCAGASTAMLLSRRGHRVLLLDRNTFPSDLTPSTHLLQQPGVAALVSWGLLDDLIATRCPPVTSGCLDYGPFALTGNFPDVDGVCEAYPPRRISLDQILVDAAVATGAEFRDASTVEGFEFDDGTVTGVPCRSGDGTLSIEGAHLVVGADGMNSTIARSVQAPEYRAGPALQGTYFTYWSGVPIKGVRLNPREHRAVGDRLTEDGLALVGASWAAADVPDVRGDATTQCCRCRSSPARRRPLSRPHRRWPSCSDRSSATGSGPRASSGCSPARSRSPSSSRHPYDSGTEQHRAGGGGGAAPACPEDQPAGAAAPVRTPRASTAASQALSALFVTQRRFLSDFDDPWVEQRCEELAYGHRRALACYAEACLQLGPPSWLVPNAAPAR